MQSRYTGTAGGGQAGRGRPGASFKAVGVFVPRLVRESCRKRGFVNVDIVLRWREIVGDRLAGDTWPLRIEWPRRQEAVLRPDGTEAPGSHRTRLVVGATPARALDVEYAKGAIIERVNGYLGYRAATELTAAPDYGRPAPEAASRPGEKKGAGAAAAGPPQAGADPLAAALERLGKSVAGRCRR
jgi:hypothetical protein